MASVTRIYVTEDASSVRLVRANHPNTARGFVAQGIKVRVASQDDIAELVRAGIDIELARPENGELAL